MTKKKRKKKKRWAMVLDMDLSFEKTFGERGLGNSNIEFRKQRFQNEIQREISDFW